MEAMINMRDGFIRVAAATPKVRVADTVFNGEQVVRLMEEGYEKGAKLMVFPELCLTAYTCGAPRSDVPGPGPHKWSR